MRHRLNDLVGMKCENSKNFDGFELDLSPDLTKEYRDEEGTFLYLAIANLVDEMREYRRGKIRAITRLGQQREEIFDLLSTGQPLNEATLKTLNEHYKIGRALETPPFRHGSRHAAYFLAKLKGVVLIENHTNGIFTVRNRVILP